MLLSRAPVIKDLFLLGGGHAHLEVLRSFGMRPMDGVRLTLVTKDVHTPYSGMLPGFVSGFYSYDDCHINLARLANFAKARLVHAAAFGLDIKGRKILLQGRPPLTYDVLSVNLGISPGLEGIPGAREHTTPVKPIDGFVHRLELLLQRCRSTYSNSSRIRNGSADPAPNGVVSAVKPMRVVVVGGGAGGVEICLALQYRLQKLWAEDEQPPGSAPLVTLVSRGPILRTHPSYARRSFLSILHAKGVELLEGADVAAVMPGMLQLKDGTQLAFDECLWCTQAKAAGWLESTGLPTDTDGFLAINECLQSEGGPPEVFAVGDVASCARHPRPKAGVFAVRQGPPLAENLRRSLAGQPLLPHAPQTTNLSLITTGDKACVGTKGWLGAQGQWLWRWKDSIDRTFMRKYDQDLPDMMAAGMAGKSMSSNKQPAAVVGGAEALSLLAAAKMRCGGCGAKVGADALSRALARLPPQPHNPSVVIGLASPDDAAVVRPPPSGYLSIHTVDFFRALWEDPWLFGRIAANHALGDCYAMGGQPSTALALAVIPFAAEAKVEEDLFQLMSGASEALSEAGCTLVGGHSSEGTELSAGFCVNGHVAETKLMRKGGLLTGQALILTKPIGSGAIMAAAMQGKAQGRWVLGALQSMAQPSGAAATILWEHGCSGCTDVTGFGLLGHLAEMTRGSQVSARLHMSDVPLMDGALSTAEQGIASSLHEQNARVAALLHDSQAAVAEPRFSLLVDPQTAGGLLAGVPEERAVDCIKALQQAGYSSACIVGEVMAQQVNQDDKMIELIV